MIKIRTATKKDLASITKILKTCFPEDFANKDEAITWVKERFASKTFSKYHLAEEEGKVIGYTYHFMLGGTSGVLQLEQIAVDPKYRKKGVGTQLILESEKFWQKYFQKKFHKPLLKIILTTSEINDKAHNLYAKCGFKYEATIKNLFFGSNEEVWVK